MVIAMVIGLIATPALAGNPRLAPAFELHDSNGELHTLARYQGKVLVVNFWATWCAPCREEMPSLERLGELLKQDGVVVLAIDFGEPADAVIEFAKETGISLPLLIDHRGTQAPTWGVRALPTTYIVDRQGQIVHTVHGERQWDKPEIVESIRAIATRP
jgi:peroxiredoxin